MMVFAGGPGNSLPTGTGFRIMTKSFDPFTDEYTIYFVTRKMGQPGGYTTRDMAGDYAQMISIDLGGYVETAALIPNSVLKLYDGQAFLPGRVGVYLIRYFS